jgi:hypothetical protein
MSRTPLHIIAIILCLIIASAACTSNKSEPYHSGGYSISQLQEDFDRYVELIYKDHPMTFTDRTVLERTITARKKLLRDGMSAMEFYNVVAPAGAAVRCGHTRTYLSERGREYFNEHGLCLPFDIRVIDDSLYVYKDFTSDESVPRGSLILSINKHAAAGIIERMRASVHADGTNVTYKNYAINLFFARLFTLLYGGSEQFTLVIQEPEADEPVAKIVAALTPNRSDRVDKERYPPKAGCRRLCMEFSDNNSYAVLTIRDFGNYGEADAFRKPVGDFFARLTNTGTGALILDVRGNDGGDPYCSSFVASHLIDRPIRYFVPGTVAYNDLVNPIPVPRHVFTGELYVLTDGWCFSSTGHLLSLLHCHRRGIFISEETGGSGTCTDASKEHVLKHTGLRLNLPRRTFTTSARCLPRGRGIPPDVEVQSTIRELIAGRDVVLETAVSLVGSR